MNKPTKSDQPVSPGASRSFQRETRTRVVEGGGQRWNVREEPWPGADKTQGSCLVFDAGAVVRRISNFPPDWHDWADADLYRLSDRTD